MTEQKEFTLDISSRYAGWWRYNLALMCGCFDAQEVRTNFVSTESHVADVGSNLATPPTDFSSNHCIHLVTPPCDHVVAYLYIIPHTLPTNNNIGSEKPFDVELTIRYGSQPLRSEHLHINQWSGTSIELRIEKPSEN